MKSAFTGRHITAILVGFFGVVIAVNVTMAAYASGTFGGLVVENSYVASQQFNGWLRAAKTANQLDWHAVTAWRPDGRLAVTIDGPGPGARMSGLAWHPLGRLPDVALDFVPSRKNTFISRQAVPDGRWILRLEVTESGRVWRREETLR